MGATERGRLRDHHRDEATPALTNALLGGHGEETDNSDGDPGGDTGGSNGLPETFQRAIVNHTELAIDQLDDARTTHLARYRMAPTTIIIGLFTVVGGLYVLRNPRIQGARDVKLITSEKVSSAERYTAYVAGILLVLVGLAITYLGIRF